MDTKLDLKDAQENRIVYIRQVAVADLPDEVRREIRGLDTIYAVHDTEGERIALVKDRRMAFVLARQNDMAPVSVH